jgi:hypothetical protein
MDGVRALVTYGAAAVPRSPVTPEPHGKTGPPRPSGTCIHGDTSISALACRTLLSNDLRQDGRGTISQIHVASKHKRSSVDAVADMPARGANEQSGSQRARCLDRPMISSETPRVAPVRIAWS